MKHITPIALCLCASVFNLSASVPLRWTVETSRATPAQFEAYQGETLALEAALQSYGKPLEAPSNYALYWQTNGMGNAYWSAPCQSSETTTNVLFATWSPTNDVGARVYNCFIGQPGTIYHAAFQLRLRPSPGETPNELPLPQKVIDFAKVRVLNPPWSGGGVNTNAVRDIVRDQLATNGIRSVDGAARPLPKYLHALDFDDSYPEAAAEYYRSRGNGKTDGGCSSVRDGGFLYRNFDYPFDDRAEFVVKMSAANGRFASVGVAQVGTNLTEQIVTSGKWSKWYKALPGATVDGINENGVACNINVVDGAPAWNTEPTAAPLHPLAAVRLILDNATNAQHAAEYIAANIRFPSGWTQNFHYMIADERDTYIVENGTAYNSLNFFTSESAKVITNFLLERYPVEGGGLERFDLLYLERLSITNVWYTNAYRRETNPPWVSDLQGLDTNLLFRAWAAKPKEQHRGETFGDQTWWQTVHTSVYDITNRVLRVAVQEHDDWYTFQVPSSGAKIDAYTKAETDEKLAGKVEMPDVEAYHEEHVPTLDDVCNSGFDAGNRSVIFSDVTANAFHTPYGDFEGDYINTSYGQLFLPGNVNYGSNNDDLMTRGQTPVLSSYNQGYAANADLADYATALYRGNERRLDLSMTQEGDTRWSDIDGGSEEPFAYLSEVPNISATDPTFSNAVDQIVRSIMPTTLRAYDPVRQCWWKIQPVNGILTLTVED